MSETVIFFGSGPVAAQSLALLAQHCEIEAVVTKPKPPHHKGSFPVVELAESMQLPIVTASNKVELSQALAKRQFTARVAVLIDFGIIVSQDVIDRFPLGIINSHFSLLPQWRGADPITFSVLSGQEKTGVSLMLLVEKMDEGPLLAVGEYDLPSTITTPELSDGLIQLSDGLLRDTLPKYIAGQVKSASQTRVATLVGYPAEPSYSRKLTKSDSILDWQKSAIQLEREVRAFIEWPKSRTTLAGQEVIITKSHAETGNKTPGTVVVLNKKIGIHTTNGIFVIDSLKPAGKSNMSVEAFLAGYGKKLQA